MTLKGWDGMELIQGGPLPVVNGVIIPISRVINPVTHLEGYGKSPLFTTIWGI